MCTALFTLRSNGKNILGRYLATQDIELMGATCPPLNKLITYLSLTTLCLVTKFCWYSMIFSTDVGK